MEFIAEASSEASFKDWVKKIKKSSDGLGIEKYSDLSKPSENNPVQQFALTDNNLFDYITHQFSINPEVSYEAGI